MPRKRHYSFKEILLMSHDEQARKVPVNDIRRAFGLGPLTRADGALDLDGALTLAQFVKLQCRVCGRRRCTLHPGPATEDRSSVEGR